MAQLTTHMTTEKTIALTVWTFLGIALTVRTFVQASLITQLLKKRPAMLETPLQFLGWEDPLEKGKATHFTILA